MTPTCKQPLQVRRGKIPQPRRGQAYLDYLRKCAAVVATWPRWVSGERRAKR
jgi:hypothetical protein